MTDTTWHPPPGKPEDMLSSSNWREIADWEDWRNSELTSWLERHFTHWWLPDARGGLVELGYDDKENLASGTDVLVACKECAALVVLVAGGDEQPHLNTHRAFHDRLEELSMGRV